MLRKSERARDRDRDRKREKEEGLRFAMLVFDEITIQFGFDNFEMYEVEVDGKSLSRIGNSKKRNLIDSVIKTTGIRFLRSSCFNVHRDNLFFIVNTREIFLC